MSNSPTKPRWIPWYCAALLIALLAFLIVRRDEVVGGATSVFDVGAVVLLVALALSPLFSEVTFGFVTLKREVEQAAQRVDYAVAELRSTVLNTVAVSPVFNVSVQQLVQQEVVRVQAELLKRNASWDLELIPVWERENSSTPNADRLARYRLLQARVTETENALQTAAPNEHFLYGELLRNLYWEFLIESRNAYASSTQFQRDKSRIEAGLRQLSTRTG